VRERVEKSEPRGGVKKNPPRQETHRFHRTRSRRRVSPRRARRIIIVQRNAKQRTRHLPRHKKGRVIIKKWMTSLLLAVPSKEEKKKEKEDWLITHDESLLGLNLLRRSRRSQGGGGSGKSLGGGEHFYARGLCFCCVGVICALREWGKFGKEEKKD